MKMFAKGFVALAIFGIINFGLNFDKVEAEEIISDINIGSESVEIQELYRSPLPPPRHRQDFHRNNPPPPHRPGFHRNDPPPPPHRPGFHRNNPPPPPPPVRRGHYPPPRHW